MDEFINFLKTLLAQVAEEAATKAVERYAAAMPVEAQQQPQGDRFLTVSEVAEMLKVTPQTLWRWDNDGRLPKLHIGGKVRYRLSDVSLFTRTQKIEA